MQYGQSRYQDYLSSGISAAALLMTAGSVPPTRTQGVLTVGRQQSNTEDVFFSAVAGNNITLTLRGLSQTALTPTEVAGNKKVHAANESIEMTVHHLYDANKARLDEDNTFSGTNIFADDKARSATNAPPVDEKSFANKKYVDDHAVAAGVASISKFGSPALAGVVTMTGAGAATLNQVGQNIEVNVPTGAGGVTSVSKFGSPALVGAVTLTGAGGGVTLNQVGQNIEINVPAGGGGTVTSVDAAAPADVFTVAGGPIVGAGTLTFSKVNQAKNKVYVGPSAGADAAPTFRVLQKEDVQSANAAALLPGAGITITDNGNGTFTIASTGGGSGFGGNNGFNNTPNSDPTATDWWTTIIPAPFEGSGPSETPWANMSPAPTPKGGGTSSIYGIATAKADLGTNKLANAFIGDNSTIAFFDPTHQFIAKYFARYAVSTGVAEFTGIGFFVGNAMDSNAGKITNAVQDRIVISSYNGAFYGITCTGGAVSSVNLGAYTVTDKVHTFGIVVDGTTRVKFYVDGLLAGALTTNIPASGSVNFGMYGSSAASNVGAGILSDIAITQSTVASPSSNGGIFGGMQTLPTTGLKLGADVDLGNAVDSSDDSIWSWDLGATTLQRSYFLNASGVYQQTRNPLYNAIAAGTGTLQSNMFIYNGYAYIANILVAGAVYDLRFTVIRLTDGNNMGETNALFAGKSVVNEPVASICCSADGYIYVTTQAVPGINASHVNKAQITGVLVIGAATQTNFTKPLDFGGNQSWVSYKKTSVTDNFFLMVSYYDFVLNSTLDEAFAATDSRVLFMGTTSTNKTIVGIQPYVGAYTPLNSLVVYLLDTVGIDTGTTYAL